MKRFRADLHVHSCLSPCADIDNSPLAIARTAAELGIDLLALTDHNAAGNLDAHKVCCARYGITPVFGMELTTAEEAHVLCLFGDIESAKHFESAVRTGYPRFPSDRNIWHRQFVVGPDEEILDEIGFTLAAASDFDIARAVHEVHALGGLCIAAHIDRAYYSMYSQLGFLPDEAFDAVEITLQPEESERKIARRGIPYITNSDCHVIADLSRRHTEFEAEDCSLAGFKDALERGRVCPRWLPPRRMS